MSAAGTTLLDLPRDMLQLLFTWVSDGVLPMVADTESSVLPRDWEREARRDRERRVWPRGWDVPGRPEVRLVLVVKTLQAQRALAQTCRALWAAADWRAVVRVLEPYYAHDLVSKPHDAGLLHDRRRVGGPAADGFYSADYWRLLLVGVLCDARNDAAGLPRAAWSRHLRPAALVQAVARARHDGMEAWRASLRIDWRQRTRAAAPQKRPRDGKGEDTLPGTKRRRKDRD